MKAMIIMHLRDQMQKVIDEQGLPDVVFHVLFCFGYTNIGIEKCEKLKKSISRRDNSPADKPGLSH